MISSERCDIELVRRLTQREPLLCWFSCFPGMEDNLPQLEQIVAASLPAYGMKLEHNRDVDANSSVVFVYTASVPKDIKNLERDLRSQTIQRRVEKTGARYLMMGQWDWLDRLGSMRALGDFVVVAQRLGMQDLRSISSITPAIEELVYTFSGGHPQLAKSIARLHGQANKNPFETMVMEDPDIRKILKRILGHLDSNEINVLKKLSKKKELNSSEDAIAEWLFEMGLLRREDREYKVFSKALYYYLSSPKFQLDPQNRLDHAQLRAIWKDKICSCEGISDRPQAVPGPVAPPTGPGSVKTEPGPKKPAESLPALSPGSSLAVPEAIPKYTTGLFRIVTDDPDHRNVGTGFLIESDLVVTCTHVIRRVLPPQPLRVNSRVNIRLAEDDREIAAEVIYCRANPNTPDEQLTAREDICLLRICASSDSSHKLPHRFNLQDYDSHIPCFAFGFPPANAIAGMLVKDIEIQYEAAAELVALKTKEEIIQGMSGAPLRQTQAQLVAVGMIVARAGSKTAYMVSSKNILSAIADWKSSKEKGNG